MPLNRKARRALARLLLYVWNNHTHGRRGKVTRVVMPILAQRVNGASLEPNTNPHLITFDDVARYYDVVHKAAPGRHWRVSFYLTPETKLKDVTRAYEAGLITHVKKYPGGVTTHSAHGVTTKDVLNKNSRVGKFLTGLSETRIPLKGHDEVLHWDGVTVNAKSRERLTVRELLPRELELYPNLRRIVAHISTKEMVEWLKQVGDVDTYIAELTSHHGYFDDSIFFEEGNVIPDHHCNPCLKEFDDNQALRALVRRKPSWLVAGPDDAIHMRRFKHCFRAMGGFNTYHCSTELYLQLLDEEGVLDYAQDFLFNNAKRFHGKQIPDWDELAPIEFVRGKWTVDAPVKTPAGAMTPFGYDPDPNKRHVFTWKLAA